MLLGPGYAILRTDNAGKEKEKEIWGEKKYGEEAGCEK
jgi:hypothetical protein